MDLRTKQKPSDTITIAYLFVSYVGVHKKTITGHVNKIKRWDFLQKQPLIMLLEAKWLCFFVDLCSYSGLGNVIWCTLVHGLKHWRMLTPGYTLITD